MHSKNMFYLSHIPDEGFRLWHLMDSRGGCEGWGGVLGPATSSPAPSVHPDSAYSPVIAYIDSCLLLIRFFNHKGYSIICVIFVRMRREKVQVKFLNCEDS